MKKRYGKLIRDKIPEIIRSDESVPVTRVMDTDEYRRELLYKLIEEAEEVRKAGYDLEDKVEVTKKLADLSEVIDATLTEFDISKKLLNKIQNERHQQRGGFKNKIFLESIQ